MLIVMCRPIACNRITRGGGGSSGATRCPRAEGTQDSSHVSDGWPRGRAERHTNACKSWTRFVKEELKSRMHSKEILGTSKASPLTNVRETVSQLFNALKECSQCASSRYASDDSLATSSSLRVRNSKNWSGSEIIATNEWGYQTPTTVGNGRPSKRPVGVCCQSDLELLDQLTSQQHQKYYFWVADINRQIKDERRIAAFNKRRNQRKSSKNVDNTNKHNENSIESTGRGCEPPTGVPGDPRSGKRRAHSTKTKLKRKAIKRHVSKQMSSTVSQYDKKSSFWAESLILSY